MIIILTEEDIRRGGRDTGRLGISDFSASIQEFAYHASRVVFVNLDPRIYPNLSNQTLKDRNLGLTHDFSRIRESEIRAAQENEIFQNDLLSPSGVHAQSINYDIEITITQALAKIPTGRKIVIDL
jgi:hypothetical protein